MLELIRWKNIALVCITILAITFTFMPIDSWTEAIFSILSLCIYISCFTIFGYLLNDAYDQSIDAINHPMKRTNHLSKSWLIKVAIGFGLVGFIIVPVGLSEFGRSLTLLGITVFLLLWAYNAFLKCMPIWGNILVALLCALVPLCTLFIYQEPLMVIWVIAYTIFAYGSNLIREIVKDVEDLDGDRSAGCETLPVRIGFLLTKKILLFINSIFILALIAAMWILPLSILSKFFYILMIILPAAWIFLKTATTVDYKHYSRISMLSKSAMVLALIFLLMQKWI